MKNYDNYFLPVDNMEEAKRYYDCHNHNYTKKFPNVLFLTIRHKK